MRRRRSNFSGFTLLELVFVLVILAVLAAMVAPSLRSFGIGRSNEDTATLLVGLAGYAHTQSASEGRVYRLNFDVPGRAFWLTAQQGAAFVPPTNDFGRRCTAADGVAQMSVDLQPRPDGDYVEFQPTGLTDPAPVQIRLIDKLGGSVGVACLSSTETFQVLPKQGAR